MRDLNATHFKLNHKDESSYICLNRFFSVSQFHVEMTEQEQGKRRKSKIEQNQKRQRKNKRELK